MIAQILYFLPCLVSLVCFVSLLMKVRTSRQNLFMTIQLCDVVYYVMYALYVAPKTDFDAMVRLDAVASPLLLCIAALTISYIDMHRTKSKFNVTQLFLLAPALLMAAVVGLLYYLIGFNDAAAIALLYDQGQGANLPAQYSTQLHQIFILFSGPIFRVISLLMMAVIITECVLVLRKYGYRLGNIVRFLTGRGESSPSSVIAVLFLFQLVILMPLAALGRSAMTAHVVFGLVLTFLLAAIKLFIYHVEVYSDAHRACSLHSLTHVEAEAALAEEETAEEAASEHVPSTKIDALAERFRVLMEEEKLYKDENLTAATLAERMEVGRTTLSVMINQKYGLPFRDLLNHYRIEAVKAYLMENPTATQETLAFECGFKYASALNRKFKEAEGETPFTWIAKHAPGAKAAEE